MANDDQPDAAPGTQSSLTAWCPACRATQPCAAHPDDADPATPSYRCAVCGAPAPNPVLRLVTRHTAA